MSDWRGFDGPGDDTEGGDPADDVTSVFLRRGLEGHQESLEEAIRRLTPLLYSSAAYRLRAVPSLDPADLVSEIWLKTLPRLADLAPREGRLTPVVLSFMTVALKRRVRDLLEAQLRRKVLAAAGGSEDAGAGGVPADTAGVITKTIANECRGIVHRAIEELEAQDREIVILRGIEQSSTQDVATVLGISPEAVRKRYSRALQRLRDRLPGSVFFELI